MTLSIKQRRILGALIASKSLNLDDGTITLEDATRLVGSDLYCNARKHVGAVLSRMVDRGLIERVKPGVFRLHSINPHPSTLNFQ
jgi:predicted transcriptional regulator of viral defense system